MQADILRFLSVFDLLLYMSPYMCYNVNIKEKETLSSELVFGGGGNDAKC